MKGNTMTSTPDCTCKASDSFTREPIYDALIEHCDMHRAAPVFLAALQRIAYLIPRFIIDRPEPVRSKPSTDQLMKVLRSIHGSAEEALKRTNS